MKTCTVCKEEKEDSEFYKSGKGLHHECKQCMKSRVRQVVDKEKRLEASRRWRENNKERSVESSRKVRYKKMYGLSIEDYDKMVDEQGGCCKICKTHSLDLKERLHVDHNHITGKIRGLLCRKCNLLLGHSEDDPEILLNAALYLKGQ